MFADSKHNMVGIRLEKVKRQEALIQKLDYIRVI
ncbi:MAG: hypothetical protein ACJA1A_001910 [Saprospiraceae bacterium]|jgi:hypothetical protein